MILTMHTSQETSERAVYGQLRNNQTIKREIWIKADQPLQPQHKEYMSMKYERFYAVLFAIIFVFVTCVITFAAYCDEKRDLETQRLLAGCNHASN